MLTNYTYEKDFAIISQDIKTMNRLISRDYDKLLFQGLNKSVLECFEKNFLLLNGLQDDKYYKRKLLVKLNSKNKHKKKLLCFYQRFVRDASIDKNCELQVNVSLLSDKELMRASCYLLEHHKDALEREQYLRFENEIVLFEETLFELNHMTLLRIEKSLERYNLIDQLVNNCIEICKYGQMVWKPINYMNYSEFKLFTKVNQKREEDKAANNY